MATNRRSLFTIAHDANEHFLKLYETSVTSVGLLDASVVCIDCLVTGVRILAIQIDDPAGTVRIVVGDKEMGTVKHTIDFNDGTFTDIELLRLMEEWLARAQPDASS